MKQSIKTFYFLILFSTFNTIQGVLDIETKSINSNPNIISGVAEGTLIVLDFRATWCKPCIKLIPKLLELSEKFDNNLICFIGINEDSPRNIDKVKPFVNSVRCNISYIIRSRSRDDYERTVSFHLSHSDHFKSKS
jgi:thiol-disulfide isomerase/thioredoxin